MESHHVGADEPMVMDSSTNGEERHDSQGGASVHNNSDTTETVSILERTNSAQQDQIKGLQRELNELRVQRGEEVYWLRLELDSSRRDKEAVEDRMSELYREMQELLEAPIDKNEGAEANNGTVKEVCTEPDYVSALQDRLTAYERSVEILNRQIEMIKTSSDVVVASMKQEVTDLMEEKTIMERDMLNQLSSLDNDKRKVEVELAASRAAKHSTVNGTAQIMPTQSTDVDTGVEALDEDIENSNKLPEAFNVTPAKGVHEESFRSTATTQVSSFVVDGSHHPASFFFKEHDEDSKVQLLLEKSREEVERWKEEAETSTMDNIKLKGKLDEVTKELMFTRSSANVALALDRIETDRAETLAQLDRITVLWDRADSTIQVMEGLLSEFQPKSGQPEDNPTLQNDRDRLLSTLETATLVHGQIKMSLMLIELSLRNHLTCIQNDNLHMPRSEQIVSRLEDVRSETLSAIAAAEDKWTGAVEAVEKQILSENQSINDSLKVQLGELQKAQERHRSVQVELEELKNQPPPLQTEASSEANSTQAVTPTAVATGTDFVAADDHQPPNSQNGQVQSNGLIVSPGTMARLQKEILTVVALVQEKNEAIRLLMTTIDKHRLREEVLKKELKRVAQKSSKKIKSKDAKVPKPPKLDLMNIPHASKGKVHVDSSKSGSGKSPQKKVRKSQRTNTAELTVISGVVAEGGKTRKTKSSRLVPFLGSGSNRGWSSL
ncbi:expressed unknown protein [Seminavis robusta]|uniref:Uncharacterized protein n=1 Tax=Seminavis robusta TaxID=568900 RepID=A0A9N8EM06_9STRA|nr:expressed unknown protein [Seminavis robusta]|eukprot:Sro1152_g246890.1 n/a (723) ;mRNA; r:16498-18666